MKAPSVPGKGRRRFQSARELKQCSPVTNQLATHTSTYSLPPQRHQIQVQVSVDLIKEGRNDDLSSRYLRQCVKSGVKCVKLVLVVACVLVNMQLCLSTEAGECYKI